MRLALAKKVRQLRMAHAAAAIAAAAAASPGEGGDEDEKTAAATALQAAMPEGVLPYVIHLLAHHPDYLSTKVSREMIWVVGAYKCVLLRWLNLTVLCKVVGVASRESWYCCNTRHSSKRGCNRLRGCHR